MPIPEWLEITKAVTEVAAFSGAAVFFGYKAVTGYLIVNLSLSASAERTHVDENWDDLAIAVTLAVLPVPKQGEQHRLPDKMLQPPSGE